MGSDNQVLEGLFFKLLPVQIVLIGMGSINAIIDGIIAGHYLDERTVGVIGLFSAVITIISAISSVILSGGAVISGNHIGTGELKEMPHNWAVVWRGEFLSAVGCKFSRLTGGKSGNLQAADG